MTIKYMIKTGQALKAEPHFRRTLYKSIRDIRIAPQLFSFLIQIQGHNHQVNKKFQLINIWIWLPLFLQHKLNVTQKYERIFHFTSLKKTFFVIINELSEVFFVLQNSYTIHWSTMNFAGIFFMAFILLAMTFQLEARVSRRTGRVLRRTFNRRNGRTFNRRNGRTFNRRTGLGKSQILKTKISVISILRFFIKCSTT